MAVALQVHPRTAAALSSTLLKTVNLRSFSCRVNLRLHSYKTRPCPRFFLFCCVLPANQSFSLVGAVGLEPTLYGFYVLDRRFTLVPGCSKRSCKWLKISRIMFLVVRRRSWRVGVLIGVLAYAAADRIGWSLVAYPSSRLWLSAKARSYRLSKLLPSQLHDKQRQHEKVPYRRLLSEEVYGLVDA